MPLEPTHPSPFTHLDADGRPRMVDVTGKPATARVAVARAAITMQRETLDAIRQGTLAKGDVLAVAQVAGVMAAKQTGQWIPMCHPLPLTGVEMAFGFDAALSRVTIEASVRVYGPTGVEMEALTAVSAAALTIYDMAKAIDRGMVIGPAYLVSKEGGRSGTYQQLRAHVTRLAGEDAGLGALLLPMEGRVQLLAEGAELEDAAIPAAWLDGGSLATLQPGSCLECGRLRLEVLFAREHGVVAEVHRGGVLRVGDRLDAAG